MFKKMRITKGEKWLYTIGILCTIGILVVQIFGGATTGNIGMSIERVKRNIETQEKKNESLTMKISELTSFTNVNDIIKNMGLAYNYDNIVNIDK